MTTITDTIRPHVGHYLNDRSVQAALAALQAREEAATASIIAAGERLGASHEDCVNIVQEAGLSVHVPEVPQAAQATVSGISRETLAEVAGNLQRAISDGFAAAGRALGL